MIIYSASGIFGPTIAPIMSSFVNSGYLFMTILAVVKLRLKALPAPAEDCVYFFTPPAIDEAWLDDANDWKEMPRDNGLCMSVIWSSTSLS